MQIWIILVDLILTGAFFLSGLFFLFLLCFGKINQSEAHHGRPRPSNAVARLMLALLCVILFSIAWYNFRCLLRKELAPLPAVLLQAPLLWMFGSGILKVVVIYWRHWRVKVIADSGRDDEAIELIEHWIRTSRQPGAELHNLIGLLHLKTMDWESAARKFRLAADMSDESPMYLSNLAIALNGMGRTEEALELIEHAEQKDPFNSERYAFNHCYFLALAGRTEEARTLLPQAERFCEKSNRQPPLQRRWFTETMSKIHALCDRSPGDPD